MRRIARPRMALSLAALLMLAIVGGCVVGPGYWGGQPRYHPANYNNNYNGPENGPHGQNGPSNQGGQDHGGGGGH